MSQELINRLRSHAWEPSLLRKYREEAADLIEQQTAEIERLRVASQALIDFHNGPPEAQRPDVFHRLLVKLNAALAEQKEGPL